MSVESAQATSSPQGQPQVRRRSVCALRFPETVLGFSQWSAILGEEVAALTVSTFRVFEELFGHIPGQASLLLELSLAAVPIAHTLSPNTCRRIVTLALPDIRLVMDSDNYAEQFRLQHLVSQLQQQRLHAAPMRKKRPSHRLKPY